MQSRLSRGPTARIVSGFPCVCFAPGRLSLRREPSPAFLAVLSWGSQLDLVEGMETSVSLSPSSPARACVRSLGLEALSAVSSPWGSGSGGGGEVSLVDPVRYEKEAAPSILSLTGTRRPSNRRWHFSVFSLAVL